jgi:uncharacterized protein involved in exopolysaccharide biosynthesis
MTSEYSGPNTGTGTAASLMSAAAFLLRHRRVFVIVFVAVATMVVIVGYPKTTYTSVVSFVTEAQRGGAVGNLAAQLGVIVPNTQNSFTSPLFYPELLKSQQFMASVVEAKYPSGKGNDSSSLIDIWGMRSPDPRMSRELASRILDESMFIAVAPQTGIVKVAVTTGDPRLSQSLAQTILRKVHEFNTRARQGRATAERHFVEQRLAEIRSDLRVAEDRLQAFLQENRDFSKSPTLQFQRTRLEQEVMLQRQITMAMAQSYEQAKIDEVRDTPVVTVLSEPDLPVLPDPRGRIRLLLIAIFAGMGAGVVALWALSQFRNRSGEAQPDRAELARIASEINADLRSGRVLQAVLGRRANGVDAGSSRSSTTNERR